MSNEEALGFGSLILGVGMLGGIMMSNNQNYDLKELVRRDISSFKYDMLEDVYNGAIDSSAASYYIHNFNVILDQLEEEQYELEELYYYEQNSRNTTRCSGNRMDSVCNCGDYCSNYKLNTNTNG